MKTLVVYDSLYGNTRTIAQAIGDAIPGEVEVLQVGDVNASELEAYDLLIVGAPIRATVLFLPVSFLIIAMFTLGLSLALSAMAVYFEDVSHMYQVATVGLMYMTPIIYPISIIPAKWMWVIQINPLTQLFKLARDPVYSGTLPSLHVFTASLALSVVMLVAGWVIFHRLARGFYLHL